jgi:hypothetical protein
MGCDIHWVLETKTADGKWVGILASDVTDVPAGTRWYAFFREFGVRGESPTAIEPRGWPDDISDLTKLVSPSDHSHSWVTLAEFEAAYQRAIDACPGCVSTVKEMFGHWFGRHYLRNESRVIMAFDS